jgi:hypothetical protein
MELTTGHLTVYQSSVKQELTKDALNMYYCKSIAALGITMSIHQHPDVDMAHSKDLIALVFEEGSTTLLNILRLIPPRNSLTHSKLPSMTPSHHINSPCSLLSTTAACCPQMNPTATF